MVALRDNEDAARSFTITATRRKLEAFAIAGFLAGIGGAVYAFALARISYANFGVGLSIDAVAMTVIGGIGVLAGPLIGAIYIFGIPDFVPLDSAGLAASAAGWLFLVLYFPSGLASFLNPMRRRALALIGRRYNIDPEDQADALPSPTVRLAAARRSRPEPGTGLIP